MRQSQLFAKTRKQAPKGEVSKNAQLLIRAGYIDKLQSGVYTFLPLGLKVVESLEKIISQEMEKAGGQRVLMPALHPKENWLKTGRWDSMDDLYKVRDASGKEFALGPTHEEVVVPLMKQFISSYKDLPRAVYQVQTKFRSELRAKSGLLRGREFLMKDLYSFHKNEEELKSFYERMKLAYQDVFRRAGIGERTFFTYAAGSSFSKFSHEFQTLTEAGEDYIHICDNCAVAINEEIIETHPVCPECGKKPGRREKAVEVGNIFELKTKFSDAFGLAYKDEEGRSRPVVMGCYGIGISRLMGAIAEIYADKDGLVWPKEASPFSLHLVLLSGKNQQVREKGEELYYSLLEKGVSVLYDDRDASAGEKLSDSDLLGISWRAVLSEKTFALGKVEIRDRQTKDEKLIKTEHIAEHLNFY